MQLAQRVTPRRNDGGFTLVELLIVIVLLGIITIPLANLMAGYFHNTTQTAAILSESHDTQIASAYWQQDVSSLGLRQATYDTATKTFTLLPSVDLASSPCSQAGANPVTNGLLAWDEFDSSGIATEIRVAYVTQTAGGESQLLRLHCTASASPDTIAVLAHNVDPANPPAIACSTACVGSVADPVPQVMTMTLKIADPTSTINKGVPYTALLTGQRRQTP